MIASLLDSAAQAFSALDAATITLVLVVFFAAGIIKGIVGFGMPLFAISTLATIMPMTTAIAANVLPSLLTNVRQAFRGPYLIALFRRLWPFLIPALGLIWFGIAIQVRVDPAYPGLLLGLLALAFAAISATSFSVSIKPEQEIWTGPLTGIVNGLMTGLTGIFIIPSGLYLQALGLSRDQLVQALGLLFMLSTAVIGVSFAFKSILTAELAMLSALAVPSAFAGMAIGERLRSRLSERLFRKLFLVGIAIIGVSLVLRNGASLLERG